MPRLNSFFTTCLTVAAAASSCSRTTDASLFLSEPVQVPDESFIKERSSSTMMGASDVEKRPQIRFFTVFSLLAVTGVMVYLISQCFKAFIHDRHLGIYGATLRRLAEGGSTSCQVCFRLELDVTRHHKRCTRSATSWDQWTHSWNKYFRLAYVRKLMPCKFLEKQEQCT